MRLTVLRTAALVLGLGAAAVLAQEPSGHEAQKHEQQIQHEAAAASGHSVEPAEHGDAHGGEGHGEEHAAVPFYKNQDLWKFINLAVILYFGLRMGGGTIGLTLDRRSRTIRTELDEARAALENSEKRFDEAEYRLARLHDELERMRQDGQRTAQAEKERIVADAHTAAGEMRQKTQQQIQLEMVKAKADLRQYMAGLVVARVREDLQRRVEREGDAPFVNTILQRVEALN